MMWDGVMWGDWSEGRSGGGGDVDGRGRERAEHAVATHGREPDVQGVSGFRRPIYCGPAPPPGKPHHYHFVVFALDATFDLKPGLSRM